MLSGIIWLCSIFPGFYARIKRGFSVKARTEKVHDWWNLILRFAVFHIGKLARRWNEDGDKQIRRLYMSA